MKANKEAVEQNRWLLEAQGEAIPAIEDKMSKLNAEIKDFWGKIHPLEPREAGDSFFKYLLENSNSNNLLRMQQTVKEKSEKLAAMAATKDISEFEAMKSDELNQLFQGTRFNLDDIYKLNQPKVMYDWFTSDLEQREPGLMKANPDFQVAAQVNEIRIEGGLIQDNSNPYNEYFAGRNAPAVRSYEEDVEQRLFKPVRGGRDLLAIDDEGFGHMLTTTVDLSDQETERSGYTAVDSFGRPHIVH
jgi:hypothetical protein